MGVAYHRGQTEERDGLAIYEPGSGRIRRRQFCKTARTDRQAALRARHLWRAVLRHPCRPARAGRRCAGHRDPRRRAQSRLPPARRTDGTLGKEAAVADNEGSFARYKAVLLTWRLLVAGVSVGFQNAARYGLLIRVPVHFLGANWAKAG